MSRNAEVLSADIGNPSSVTSSAYLPGAPSMWFFVIGDLLIFGLYFVSYMYFRGQDTPTFLESQRHLNQGLGAFNTLVLLTSSLFVALGTIAARSGETAEAFKLFVLGLVCGAIFPVVKVFEWIPEISAGFTPGTNNFFMYYYLLAGMHLCHVLLGLVILGFVAHDLKTSKKPSINFVETGAIYWHMVDLLWLFILALFYLMR